MDGERKEREREEGGNEERRQTAEAELNKKSERRETRGGNGWEGIGNNGRGSAQAVFDPEFHNGN